MASLPGSLWFNLFNELILTQRLVPLQLILMMKHPLIMNCFEYPNKSSQSLSSLMRSSESMEFLFDYYDYYQLFEISRFTNHFVFHLFINYFKEMKQNHVMNRQGMASFMKDTTNNHNPQTSDDDVLESFYDIFQTFLKILITNTNIIYQFILKYEHYLQSYNHQQRSRYDNHFSGKKFQDKSDFHRIYEEMIMMIIALLRHLKLPTMEMIAAATGGKFPLPSVDMQSPVASTNQSQNSSIQPNPSSAQAAAMAAGGSNNPGLLGGIISWFSAPNNPNNQGGGGAPNAVNPTSSTPMKSNLYDDQNQNMPSSSSAVTILLSSMKLDEMQLYDVKFFLIIWRLILSLNPQFLLIIKSRDPSFFKTCHFILENFPQYLRHLEQQMHPQQQQPPQHFNSPQQHLHTPPATHFHQHERPSQPATTQPSQDEKSLKKEEQLSTSATSTPKVTETANLRHIASPMEIQKEITRLERFEAETDVPVSKNEVVISEKLEEDLGNQENETKAVFSPPPPAPVQRNTDSSSPQSNQSAKSISVPFPPQQMNRTTREIPTVTSPPPTGPPRKPANKNSRVQIV
jgi:hypothetical protein